MCRLSHFTYISGFMTSSFLIRIGLLLIPVALVPFAQLLEVSSHSSYHCDLMQNIAFFLNSIIPVIFAIFASLTEPNNSKSWQIVSTIIVYFVLKQLLFIYYPGIQNINQISAFASSIITAAFSSRITANTLHIKRYIFSRILNLGILLFCCVITVLLVSSIKFVLIRLFDGQDENNILLNIPSTLQTFVFGYIFQILKPFGLENQIIEFLTNNSHISYVGNISNKLFLYSYSTILFLIPAMFVALYFRISKEKRIPVFFLIFICIVTSFFPGKEGFIYLTFIWIWPGLFSLHMILSAIYLSIMIELPSIEINPLLIKDLQNNVYITKNFLHFGSYSTILLISIATFIYFSITSILLAKVPINKLSWKLKKHKSVRIKLIRDTKGSQDLSLLAIRLIKMTGGLDNISWISTESLQLKIGYNDIHLVNEEALKGFGRESYIDSYEKILCINSTDKNKIELVKQKIITFASREFLDLTIEKESF